MRGNERILFVGNLDCLSINQQNQPSWQMKRIVVTETAILFFAHANLYEFQGFGMDNGFENFTNFMKHAQPEEAYPILKQNHEAHTRILETDPDSITSPPLLIYPASQRQAMLMSLDSFQVIFQKLKIQVKLPYSVGRGIALVNKQSKEINYMLSRSFNDAFRFVRSCNLCVLYQKYFAVIQANPKLQINQTIINFLQDSVNIVSPSLGINFTSQDYELEINIYKILLETSLVINGLVIEFSILTSEMFGYLKRILTCLKPEQLLSFTLKDQKIEPKQLLELYPLLSFNQYLENIDLSNNQMDDKSLEIIARCFEHCIDLKKINLSKNRIRGNDNNFQIFLMKAAHLLTKVKINLSENLLDDNSIPIIEARVLFEESNQIVFLDVSNNRFSRQGQWRLYLSYVESRSSSQHFSMMMYPLPISVELFQHFQHSMPEKQYDYSVYYNDAMPFTKSFTLVDQSLRIPKEYKYQLSRAHFPIQIPRRTLLQLREQQREQTELKADLCLTITRISNNKQPATSKKILDQVRQLAKLGDELFESHQQDPPVEAMWYVTQQYSDCPYQIPLRIIAKMQEHLWHKLNEAILIRDHYSITFLAFSATNLDIDTKFFRDRYLRVTNRKSKLQERILKVLNFEVPEPLINAELDDLISECHRLDVRGFPLSALIYIKIERDLLIRQYALQGYDWTLEWESDPLGNAYAFIDRDIDRMDMSIPKKLVELKVNLNLFAHPQKVNYFEMCFIRLENYQEGLEKLTHLLAEQEALKDDEMITKLAIDKFHREESVKIDIFGKVAYNRLRFICHNQYLQYDYLLWRQNKEDIQMNSVRHAVYHFCYRIRRKEIYLSICSLDRSFEDLTYDQTLERIDKQDPTIENQREIDDLRFLLSDMRLKVKVRLYDKNIELPINLHEFLVNNDILIYPHLRAPSQHQIKDNRPDSILMWVNNPNISTLQRIDDEVYVRAVYEMEKSLRYIYRELSVLDNDQYETSLAYQSMFHIIDIVQRSPSTCLLADELYLQIYRYQNKLEVQDGHFAGEHQLYKVVATFLLYLPPSRNLHRFMLAWLYQKSLRFQLQKPAKKALQHLLTWEEITNGSNQYAMPDWLPDVSEIMQRFRCNPNTEILIKTADGEIHKVIIPEFATIGQLMEAIYNSEILGGVEDKYAYWVYKLANHQEIPLLKEQGVMESISSTSLTNQDSAQYLVLRRRIYCAWYTFTNDLIKGQHSDLLFFELAQSYIYKEYLVQQYEKDGMISVSTILYLAFTKIETGKKVFAMLNENRKHGIKMTEEEVRSKVLEDASQNELNLRQKVSEYIPVMWRSAVSQQDIQRIASQVVRTFHDRPVEDLKQTFLVIMKSNPCSFGSCFRVRAYEAFQETEDIKTDTLLIVNTFALTLYEWQGALQKPFKVFMFEDIIGFSVSSYQLRIHLTDVEKQFRILFSFAEERALECYMDIISYMVLRTNESIKPLYAYNEWYRMHFKENVFLNEIPNQNHPVEFILNEIAKKEQVVSTTSSFFSNVNKVTRRGQLLEQIQKLSQRYHDDERFIQLLIKKSNNLYEECQKVRLNCLMLKHFPFHLDCPFISIDRPRTTKQTEVGQYFGRQANQYVRQLFNSKRDLHGKAVIPYDVHSDSSAIPNSQSASKKGTPLLEKYKNINDFLLQELRKDGEAFRPMIQNTMSDSKPVISDDQSRSKSSNNREANKDQNNKQPEVKSYNNPFQQKSQFQEALERFNKSPQKSSDDSKTPVKPIVRSTTQQKQKVPPQNQEQPPTSQIYDQYQGNLPSEQDESQSKSNTKQPNSAQRSKTPTPTPNPNVIVPTKVDPPTTPKTPTKSDPLKQTTIRPPKGIPIKQSDPNANAEEQLNNLLQKHKKLTDQLDESINQEQQTNQNQPKQQESKSPKQVSKSPVNSQIQSNQPPQQSQPTPTVKPKQPTFQNTTPKSEEQSKEGGQKKGFVPPKPIKRRQDKLTQPEPQPTLVSPGGSQSKILNQAPTNPSSNQPAEIKIQSPVQEIQPTPFKADRVQGNAQSSPTPVKRPGQQGNQPEEQKQPDKPDNHSHSSNSTSKQKIRSVKTNKFQ